MTIYGCGGAVCRDSPVSPIKGSVVGTAKPNSTENDSTSKSFGFRRKKIVQTAT